MLSLAVAAMLLPMQASAQGNDGFFSSGSTGSRGTNDLEGDTGDTYGVNPWSGIGATGENYGTEPAPLGSGIAVLTLLGAGYAIMHGRKRKEQD